MEIVYVRLRGQPPASKQMAKNEKGRTFYEWATLIVKLLTAFAALIVALAELIR